MSKGMGGGDFLGVSCIEIRKSSKVSFNLTLAGDRLVELGDDLGIALAECPLTFHFVHDDINSLSLESVSLLRLFIGAELQASAAKVDIVQAVGVLLHELDRLSRFLLHGFELVGLVPASLSLFLVVVIDVQSSLARHSLEEGYFFLGGEASHDDNSRKY